MIDATLVPSWLLEMTARRFGTGVRCRRFTVNLVSRV